VQILNLFSFSCNAENFEYIFAIRSKNSPGQLDVFNLFVPFEHPVQSLG